MKRPLPSSLPLPRSRLTTSTGKPKLVVLNDIYGRLNVHRHTFKDSILFLVFMLCINLSSIYLFIHTVHVHNSIIKQKLVSASYPHLVINHQVTCVMAGLAMQAEKRKP